ncbi:MAG TPA: solute carrier family 23 protein [Desulfomonilia bacterium]
MSEDNGNKDDKQTAAKPSNLIYGLEDRPPFIVLVLLGFQHISVLSPGIIIVVMIASIAKLSSEEAGDLIRLSMLAMGIVAILQGLKRRGVGSGYLCPGVCGPAYIGASIAACKAGGIALLCSMLTVVGFIEIFLSRIITRLKAIFPVYIIGLVVLMVGFEAVLVSVPRFLGQHSPNHFIRNESLAVSLISISAMLIPTVWSKGKLRLYSILIGLITGYAASITLGILGGDAAAVIERESWFALPRPGHFGWSFNLAYVIPFVIAALSSTLKGVGDLTMCQKINDANWKEPDMKPISQGILAYGIGNLTASFMGGLGMSSSSSNVGLSLSLCATSRVILFALGIEMIIMAFIPKVAAIFVVMPEPVMGACLVYASSYMIVAGFQLLCAKPIGVVETFVLGISLCFSLSVDLVPQLYAGIPAWMEPLFQSSLTLATILAVGLNLLFTLISSAGKKERL